jgi:hypothetical protein
LIALIVRCSLSAALLVGIVNASVSPTPFGIPQSKAESAGHADSDNQPFKIVVLAGEDAVNIVKKKTAVQPVIEIRDRNNLPVSGVVVTFVTPGYGPSATFLNGTHTLSLITNNLGRAAVTGMRPVASGAFHIGVTASFQGHVITAVIAQANYLTAAAAASAGAAAGTSAGVGGAVGGAAAGGAATAAGLSTGVILGIVGAVAAAAAVGGVVAAKGGGSKSPATPSLAASPAGTIGGVTITIGAPH